MSMYKLLFIGGAVIASANAVAGANIEFDYALLNSNGGQSIEQSFYAEGSLTTVNIDALFTSSGDLTWAGDLLMLFTDPNGNQVQVGGYDIPWTGVPYGGDFDSSWDSPVNGRYTFEFDLSLFNLNGNGIWSWKLTNGWSNSEGPSWESDNQGGLRLQDIVIPAPGGLALLLLAVRRRRIHR